MLRCLERKSKKIGLWSLLQSKNGLKQLWDQLRQLPHVGVTETALEQFFEGWTEGIKKKYDQDICEKFEAFVAYYMGTFGSKPQEWSSVFIPETEDDLTVLYQKTTNGSESNNRLLNRFLKTYTQGSLLTMTRYLRDLFMYHLEEMNKYESGAKKTQLSSYYKVLCKLTLRVQAQKEFGVIETGEHVTAACLKLLAAEAEAEKQSESIGIFRLWCQNLILEDPRMNIYFRHVAVMPSFKKSHVIRPGSLNSQNSNENQYLNVINQSTDESFIESEDSILHSTLTEVSLEQNPQNELNFISPSELSSNDNQVV